MSDHHEIIPAGEVRIVDEQQQDDMLHPMVRAMMSRPDFGTDDMGKLMELQERYEATQAKRAYKSARAALLSDLPAVVKKNRHVSFNATQYSYADLPQVMRAVMPALERHGFSIAWRNDGDGRTEAVTCILSHRLGHSEENTRRCAVEVKKGMSAVQSAQATVTYLQRQALASILGVVTDDMPDADEAPKATQTAIDVNRNLRAVARLKKEYGIEAKEAEAHVGRPVRDWTTGDLMRISRWVDERQAPEPSIHDAEPPDEWQGEEEA